MSEQIDISESGYMIGDVLKRYRKSLGLTVPQVSAIMEKSYNMKVATKTIYGWESNQCYPPTPKMIALCEIYQIGDITAPFPSLDDSKKMMITPHERLILSHLRERPDMTLSVDRLLEITPEEIEAANSELAEHVALQNAPLDNA